MAYQTDRVIRSLVNTLLNKTDIIDAQTPQRQATEASWHQEGWDAAADGFPMTVQSDGGKLDLLVLTCPKPM